MGMMLKATTPDVREAYIDTLAPLFSHEEAALAFDQWEASRERRIVREEKKSAEANRENERLRQEVRRLRAANFALQSYIDNPSTQAGYKVRYEKLQEAVNMALDILPRSLHGLPVEPPQTIEPAKAPAWARVKSED